MEFWTSKPHYSCKMGDTNGCAASLCWLSWESNEILVERCSENHTALRGATRLLSLSCVQGEVHSDVKGEVAVGDSQWLQDLFYPLSQCTLQIGYLVPDCWICISFLSLPFSYWCLFQAAQHVEYRLSFSSVQNSFVT
jgi:hypothetical protein